MAKRSWTIQLTPLLIVVIIVGGLGYGAYHYVTDRAANVVVATQQARARFPAIRAAIVKRLAQPHPIELGAVWAMHSGRICGLVNGEGSFSGLTGMTPFYADGAHVTFALDSDPDLFAAQWVDCSQDVWVTVVGGSTEEGICGVKAHTSQCHDTDRRQPEAD
jgi:hypothetical protein